MTDTNQTDIVHQLNNTAQQLADLGTMTETANTVLAFSPRTLNSICNMATDAANEIVSWRQHFAQALNQLDQLEEQVADTQATAQRAADLTRRLAKSLQHNISQNQTLRNICRILANRLELVRIDDWPTDDLELNRALTQLEQIIGPHHV